MKLVLQLSLFPIDCETFVQNIRQGRVVHVWTRHQLNWYLQICDVHNKLFLLI